MPPCNKTANELYRLASIFVFVIAMLVVPLNPTMAINPDPAATMDYEALEREIMLVVEQRFRASANVQNISQIDSVNLQIILSNDNRSIVYLGNLLSDIVATPNQKQELIDSFIQRLEHSFEADVAPEVLSKAEFIQSLRPIVRNLEYLESSRRQARKLSAAPEQTDLLWRPIVGDLIELVALSRNGTLTFLLQGGGKTYGVTDEDAFSNAEQSFARQHGEIRRRLIGDVVALEIDEGGLAPSLIFCADSIEILAKTLGADFVLAVPSHNTVMAARNGNSHALRNEVEKWVLTDGVQKLSTGTFQRDGKRWKEFKFN